MKFMLNGEEKEASEGLTLLEVIQGMGLSSAQVAVERNLDIVPRATYAEVKIEDNDKLEVVTFVGGG